MNLLASDDLHDTDYTGYSNYLNQALYDPKSFPNRILFPLNMFPDMLIFRDTGILVFLLNR